MRDNVQKHFLARHQPCVAIGELEGNALAQYLIRALDHVGRIPGIGLGNHELKFIQFWCGVSIRSRVPMLLTQQVSPKNPVDDVDVIERARCSVNGRRVLGICDRAKRVEQLVVCPGLLGEE